VLRHLTSPQKKIQKADNGVVHAELVGDDTAIANGHKRQVRAGNAMNCAGCGVRLDPKRGSRRQKFCSYTCRDEARRARNHAISGSARRGSQAIPRSVENNADNSNACNGHFGDRASGIHGPAHVIEQEVLAKWNWRAVTSADGVVVEVAITRHCGGRL
jgi:hypothetical protein